VLTFAKPRTPEAAQCALHVALVLRGLDARRHGDGAPEGLLERALQRPPHGGKRGADDRMVVRVAGICCTQRHATVSASWLEVTY
jgi:hypothetical protein